MYSHAEGSSANSNGNCKKCRTSESNCPLKHVVVLMLENQSYDRLLGYVCGNLHDVGSKYGFTDNADPVLDHAFDPPHSFDAVTKQLWGPNDASKFYKYNCPPPETMHCLTGCCYTNSKDSQDQERSLRCFSKGKLPALHKLAEQFVVCDRWFCSVPGPTAPNKMFAHAATSDGYVGSRFLYSQGTDVRPEVRTIFESLDDNGHSWAVYGDESLMTCKTFPYVRERANTQIHSMDRFFTDCANDSLPDYTWLVPELWQQSQHPCPPKHGTKGMINGDILLGQVYEAIRGNPSLWQNTLLIITYDEAGGFPDSVVCTERVPSVTGPLADKEPQRDFKFEFLGPRVPTLLISGYLQAGKLDSRTYEHASIPRSVKDVFSLDGGPKGGTRDDGFLTAR